jgi:hypothetical protein
MILTTIRNELKHHIGFTFFGAFLGILLITILQMLIGFKDLDKAEEIFEVLHPLHVILSALATASMYRHQTCNHDKKECHVPRLVVIGYIGSIGIATISDCIIPFLGETFIGMEDASLHIGLIEQPIHISLAALIGITIAWYSPYTKFPHTSHVLLSTAASLFHILTASSAISLTQYFFILLILFFSVWIPCCISDIIFPMLFVERNSTDKINSSD